jgi:hypothetical protein
MWLSRVPGLAPTGLAMEVMEMRGAGQPVAGRGMVSGRGDNWRPVLDVQTGMAARWRLQPGGPAMAGELGG